MTSSGARPGGQTKAMSFVVAPKPSWSVEPVLSQIDQPAGKPASRRALPVVLACSQCCSVSRDATPSATRRRLASIARGEVVSLAASRQTLSVGSVWSSRVKVSPSERANRVKALGPP